MNKQLELLNAPLTFILDEMQRSILHNTFYFGIQAVKSPTDAWVYQEIIYKLKPDVIIEIGNAYGGGLLFLAHLCDALGHGRIIGVDIDHSNLNPKVKLHPRISFVEGPGTKMFEVVKGMITAGEHVLVIEDSSHSYENTLETLQLYSQLIPVGGYIICEDSIIAHGISLAWSSGPWEAITTFTANNPNFIIDETCEKFIVTWNPRGFLKRLS